MRKVRSIGIFVVIVLFFLILEIHNAEAKNILNLSKIRVPEKYGKIIGMHMPPRSERAVIIIVERHDLISVQENIAEIFKFVILENRIKLIGLEGSPYGKVDNPFRYFKEIPEAKGIKEEIAEGVFKSGEISAVEYIGLISKDVWIHGVEDRRTYEENRRQALKQDDSKNNSKNFQDIVTNVRIKLEETLENRMTENQKSELEKRRRKVNNDLMKYLEKVDKEGIGKLYGNIRNFQSGNMKAESFLKWYRDILEKYKVPFDSERIFSTDEFGRTFNELLTKLHESLVQRLTANQIEKVAEIQEELGTYMGRIDKDGIGAFNKRLQALKDDESIEARLSFLKYLRQKCQEYNLTFPDTLSSQIDFNTTAERRHHSMVKNLLKEMAATKEKNAILLIGAGHNNGVTKLLKKEKNISFVVIRPNGMEGKVTEWDENRYYLSLKGKALPLSLFELWKTGIYLKPPARTIQPDYQSHLTFIYEVSLIYGLREKGFNNDKTREKVMSIIHDKYRDLYNIEYDSILYSHGDTYIPLQVYSKEKKLRSKGMLRLSRFPISISDKEGAPRKALYPVLKHGMIGSLYYEFYDHDKFCKNKAAIIRKKNRTNISSSPVEDARFIIFLGRTVSDAGSKWKFIDKKGHHELNDKEIANYAKRIAQPSSGGKGGIPPIIITHAGGDNYDDNFRGAWEREHNTGDFARKFSTGLITSSLMLAYKKKNEKLPPIARGVLVLKSLPEGRFVEIEEVLDSYIGLGYRVDSLEDFNGTEKENLIVIVAPFSDQLLSIIEKKAEGHLFKDKVVALIVCGRKFKEAEHMNYLKAIDTITKRGVKMVTSYENKIESEDGKKLLQALKTVINDKKSQNLSLIDVVQKATNKTRIDRLIKSIRHDVKIRKKVNLYGALSNRYRKDA